MNARHVLLYRQIGAKIAYYRTLEGMSQEDLARKIAISKSTLSKSTLSKIERGKYNSGLSIATLLNIADGLKVELYSLLLCTQEELRVLRAQAEREKTKR